MGGQERVGTDLIDLQLPRGAAGSSRMPTTGQTTPQSTAPGDFVACDSISWSQGKFSWLEMSFLIAVRAISKPFYEGLKKIEDNIYQDFRKSRFSSEDLEFSSRAYTLL